MQVRDRERADMSRVLRSAGGTHVKRQSAANAREVLAPLDRCGTRGGAGVNSLVHRVVLPSPRLLDAKLPPFRLREQLLLWAHARNLRGEDHVPARDAHIIHRQEWAAARLCLNAGNAQRRMGMGSQARCSAPARPQHFGA